MRRNLYAIIKKGNLFEVYHDELPIGVAVDAAILDMIQEYERLMARLKRSKRAKKDTL